MQAKFAPRVTRVKGISERRRLPRLGKVRLGIKMISKKTGQTYPKETDYFVLTDQRLLKLYGPQPKELDVMFPVNSLYVIFPQSYTMYGQSKGVKCQGDGETATRLNEETGVWQERPCPCEYLEQKKCALRGHLQFILHKFNMGGTWQLDTSSYNSTVDLNSGLDYIAALVGRFTMIPLKLKRVPRETHSEGSKQVHYTLQIELDANLQEVSIIRSHPDKIFYRNDAGAIEAATGMSANEQYALDAPIEENPEYDEGAVVQETDENGKDPEKQPQAGLTIELLKENQFSALPKEQMIAYLKKIEERTRKPLDTPADLEDHSQAELKELYDRTMKKFMP